MTLHESGFFDTRTESAEQRGERMTVIAACMRYVDAGREVPDTLRARLSEHDWNLVVEYRDNLIEDLTSRR